MTMPRKHNRFINVAGIPYRWMLRFQPGYEIGTSKDYFYLTFEKCDTPRRRICIELHDHGSGQLVITPRTVRQVIEIVTDTGWKPENAAHNFVATAPEFLPTLHY